ncbi:MAG: metallophosphoesterase [Pseudomonadota bacterium]
MRLVHLTDPHLTTLQGIPPGRLRGKRLLGYWSWYRKRRHLHSPARLAALTNAVAEDRPEQIMVSGDLTHVGHPEEIAAARTWLDRLGSIAPTLLVPGNHDLYAADSWSHVQQQWGAYLWSADHDGETQAFPSSSTQAHVALIGVSSARPTAFFSARGRLGDAQRRRLTACLHGHAEARRFRCLMIHHPPLRGLTHWRRALGDATELESLLRDCGVELILHGHLHRNLEYRLGNDTLVFSTASASCCLDTAEAAYRIFDIEPGTSGWQVSMALKTVDARHRVQVVRTTSWTVRRPV